VKRLAALSLVATLAACSHAESSLPPTSNSNVGQIRVSLSHPVANASVKRPAFISPSTQSLSITLITINGFTPSGGVQRTVLSFAAAGCTGTTITCSFALSEPLGSDHLRIESYSSSDGSGRAISANEITQTISAGSNTISLTLNQAVDHLTLSVTPLTGGTATGSPVALGIFDSANELIVGGGQYEDIHGNAITLVVTDSRLADLTLCGAGWECDLTSTSTAFSSNYDGGAQASDAITASATVSGFTDSNVIGATAPVVLRLNALAFGGDTVAGPLGNWNSGTASMTIARGDSPSSVYIVGNGDSVHPSMVGASGCAAQSLTINTISNVGLPAGEDAGFAITAPATGGATGACTLSFSDAAFRTISLNLNVI
jgi:hypothetical protein